MGPVPLMRPQEDQECDPIAINLRPFPPFQSKIRRQEAREVPGRSHDRAFQVASDLHNVACWAMSIRYRAPLYPMGMP